MNLQIFTQVFINNFRLLTGGIVLTYRRYDVGRNKDSIWAQEIQLEEIEELELEILEEAYEALNRFCQKETKRSKNSKKIKQCWQ